MEPCRGQTCIVLIAFAMFLALDNSSVDGMVPARCLPATRTQCAGNGGFDPAKHSALPRYARVTPRTWRNRLDRPVPRRDAYPNSTVSSKFVGSRPRSISFSRA